jgi:tetratricopeptide (TPR) repeat protein
MANPYASPVTTNHSGAPTVRPVSWRATIIQLTVLGGLSLAAWLTTSSIRAIALVAAAYLAYSFVARFFIAGAHRRGVVRVRMGRYEEAIPAFEESYAFFARHPWVDRYRALTLLSAAAMNYREMALCNLGFCFAQIGDAKKAKEYYLKALSDFPDSILASASLRMIEAGEGAARFSSEAISSN